MIKAFIKEKLSLLCFCYSLERFDRLYISLAIFPFLFFTVDFSLLPFLLPFLRTGDF